MFAATAIALITRHLASAGNGTADAGAYACVVVAAGMLAVRRRWPLATVAVVTAALAVYLARGYPGGPVYITLFVALYSLANTGNRSLSFASAGVASMTLVAVGAAFHTGPGLVHLVFVGWTAAAVFLGDAMRSRRDHMGALVERARQSEQSREEEARRRVAEERLRIARDLHDSVAHSMATINVQAGAAAHVIDRHPEQARQALEVIQQASGEVLDELSALLGLLRLDPEERADRSPTPGLERVDALVESARRAGLDVTLRVEREMDDVPQPVRLAAYRIVQESLTNVVRHARTKSATVCIAGNGDGGLRLEIGDEGVGPGNGAAGSGVGILGMRERATATGGTLEAAARPGGGFTVTATWPGRR